MKQIFAICTVLFLGIMFGAAVAAPTELPMLPSVAVITAGLFAAGIGTKVEGVAGSLFVDVNKATRNNMGGLRITVYFGLVDDVLTWPQLADQESASQSIDGLASLTGNVIMKTGKCMFSLYGTPHTIELKSTLVGEKDAQSHKHELIFSHPGLGSKITGFCAGTNNENLFFIVQRHNGTMYMMGYEGMPATKSADESGTGAKVEDGAKANLTFEAYGPTPAPIYTGTVPLTPAGSGSGA